MFGKQNLKNMIERKNLMSNCDDENCNCLRPDLFIEDKEFVEAVHFRFDELFDVLISKHQDYGPKNISQSPGGPLNGLRVRMWDKQARINHLLESGNGPENESLRDSFLDLANYAVIGLLVLDGVWPKE